MTTPTRGWAGPVDTGAMQRLASRCWPAGLHPGGLGWAQATGQLASDILVVDDDQPGELAGWAGVGQPGSLALQVDPGRSDALEALVGRLLEIADGTELAVDVYDDPTRLVLAREGFEPVEPPFGLYRMGSPGLRASAAQVSGAVPPGYRISDVRAIGDADRVEVHRAAWRPSDLPFATGRGPAFAPETASSFTLEAYRRVRDTDLYDPTLDLVVVAPDGSPAGCCLGWFDPRTGWAEIEPLGVVPAHRRRGLAGALCAAVAARVISLGGRDLFINTADSDLYPAPFATYRKAGFTPFVRAVTMGLTRRPS